MERGTVYLSVPVPFLTKISDIQNIFLHLKMTIVFSDHVRFIPHTKKNKQKNISTRQMYRTFFGPSSPQKTLWDSVLSSARGLFSNKHRSGSFPPIASLRKHRVSGSTSLRFLLFARRSVHQQRQHHKHISSAETYKTRRSKKKTTSNPPNEPISHPKARATRCEMLLASTAAAAATSSTTTTTTTVQCYT